MPLTVNGAANRPRKGRNMTDREKELTAMLEKYQAIGNYDRLRELAEADRDGRCVVLPCKVGDTVYDTGYGRVLECVVSSVSLEIDGNDLYFLCIKAVNYSETYETYSEEDFGKTVFLTREEAEAALKDAHKPGGSENDAE